MSETELPSLEEAADFFLQALDAVATFAKAAIVAELSPLVPVYAGHVKETASAAKAAEQALERPSAALEILRAELADAERKTSEVASSAQAGAFEERAEARFRIGAYEREVGRIAEKIAAAEQDLIILTEKKNEARAKAEAAFGGMIALGDALAHPFEAPIAQATGSYAAFRAPMTWMVLLAGDKEHAEWGQAVKQWLELAKLSGLRTEDFKDDLPSDAEHFRKYWREYEAERDPAPSGQEIIAGIHAGGISGWLNALNKKTSGGKIEHWSDPKPPKPVPEREYMDVQRLRDVRT
jgi:hypothetical protein